MNYLVLLRGINVGGKASVSMALLKENLEKAGLKNVKTYINSGNVIFESEKSKAALTKEIEVLLEKTFFPIDIVVVSHSELQHIVDKVPSSWKKEDVRKYVVFLKSPATPQELITEARPKENIDFVDAGPGVVYLSTKMEGLTQSSFPKLITKPIYKLMTMRNFNTVEKLLNMMEK